ncbi:hypothetical protein D3C71_1517560 [compost metagenome]
MAAPLAEGDEALHDPLLGARHLNGLHIGEHLADRSRYLGRRFTAGRPVFLDTGGGDLRGGNNQDQRNEYEHGQLQIDRDENPARSDDEADETECVNRPAGRFLRLLHIVPEIADRLARRTRNGSGARLLQHMAQHVPSQQCRDPVAEIHVGHESGVDQRDPSERGSDKQRGDAPYPIREGVRPFQVIEERLRQQSGHERSHMNQRPGEQIQQI